MTTLAKRCYTIILVMLFGAIIDVLYFNYLIPWHVQHKHSVHNNHLDQCTKEYCPDIEHVDVRTRSNFVYDSDQSYVKSRKTSESENPSIPHIIHQTWDSENIPKMYHKWICSWMRHNPDWKYWLWTLPEISAFIKSEFPEFARLHDVYTEDIFRFDMIRYLVLYKFGGFYMDLDMESLRPLDNWTYGFECIISEETYAHPFVVREVEPPANVLNGFIAARPGHPFVRELMDSLEEFAGTYFGDYLHATGPFFLTSVLDRYLAHHSSRGDVTIVPPKFFFPTYDPNESDIISERCHPRQRRGLAEAGQLTCKELSTVFLQRRTDKQSYTDHHWVHAYLFNTEWKHGLESAPIHELIPNAKIKHV